MIGCSKAFTLIELLIVVAIIGILAAIAVPNFMNARIRAKVAKAQTDERTLKMAYMQYGMDNNVLPRHSDDIWAQDILTSPIAYIQTRMPDVFKQGLDQQPHAGLYHAEPRKEIGGYKLFPNLVTGFNGGHSVVLLGYGPAQQYNYYEYHSSNGLRSTGGLMVWIPRFSEKDAYVP